MFWIILLSALITVAFSTHLIMARNGSSKGWQAKAITEAREQTFSWAGLEIIKMFEKLPAEHRPAYDIEAAVSALDTKHDKDVVNHHFRQVDKYSYDVSNSWNCSCVYNRWADEYEEKSGLYSDCQQYFEYWELKESLWLIARALREREAAIEAHERALVLAGLESDIASVAAISADLKTEAQAISETTRELMPR